MYTNNGSHHAGPPRLLVASEKSPASLCLHACRSGRAHHSRSVRWSPAPLRSCQYADADRDADHSARKTDTIRPKLHPFVDTLKLLQAVAEIQSVLCGPPDHLENAFPGSGLPSCWPAFPVPATAAVHGGQCLAKTRTGTHIPQALSRAAMPAMMRACFKFTGGGAS